MIPPVTTDDESLIQLVRRAQAGDRGSFDKIILQEWGWVYGLSQRIQRNESDAEDASQESWVAAWKGIQKFRGNSDAEFRAWLKRVTVNRNLNILEDRKHERISKSLSDPDIAEEVGKILIGIPTNLKDIDLIQLILDRISPECRHLLVRKYYDGERYAEMSSSGDNRVRVMNRTNYCRNIAKAVWEQLRSRRGGV